MHCCKNSSENKHILLAKNTTKMVTLLTLNLHENSSKNATLKNFNLHTQQLYVLLCS